MGWETGVALGANAVNAFSTTRDAEAQSKAIATSADYNAANLANKTSRNIGSLETSFLKGGIALTGTGGPAAAIQQAGQQGITDISRTISNANASIDNTMSAARSKALNALGAGFSKLGVGTIDGAVEDAYSGSFLQKAWNGLTGNTDPSPIPGMADVGTGTGRLY